MAEVSPPLVIEAASHDSHLLRQLWGDSYTAGVIASGHLEVTEQSTPALGVTVAAGRGLVAGDEASDQGLYYVSNDAAKNIALATADATNARIDLVVARVRDSFYSGVDDVWALEAVTGTPAASPSPPAAPVNSLILAEVAVPADAGGNPPITNAEITDMRVRARSGGAAPGGVLGYAQVTAAQTGITTETDLTGLSVTVTVAASRRIRVTASAQILHSDSGNGGLGRIKEGTTGLAIWYRDKASIASHRITRERSVVLTPSSGSHTYKLTLQLDGGSGDVALSASADNPAFILVEDIGPA